MKRFNRLVAFAARYVLGCYEQLIIEEHDEKDRLRIVELEQREIASRTQYAWVNENDKRVRKAIRVLTKEEAEASRAERVRTGY
jgi:hypothetical protein